MYASETTLSARTGVSGFWGQRATLLGTEGRLVEVGTFRASWRSGRIVLEAAGVPQRFFREEERYADPQAEVEPGSGDRRDSGDYLVSTTVLLTRGEAPYLAALRFGTRLPTTDNRIGLERDQTDFFAMIGGRYAPGAVGASGEIGVGLHGTRDPRFEQSDVLTYAFSLQLSEALLQPELSVVGHADGLPDRAIRGNEELAELRLRLRSSGPRWLEIQLARGLTAFSPELGVTISGGVTH